MAKNIDKTYLFEKMPVWKALATLAIPTILNQLVTLFYNLADTFFVGQTGDRNMLAAVSLSWPFFLVLTALGNLFNIGGCSVISRALGAKDTRKASSASSFCFYASIIASLILGAAVLCFRGSLAQLLGATEANMAYTKDYIFWAFGMGTLPTVVSLTLGSQLRAEGDSKHELYGLCLGHICNVALDPIFIFPLGFGVAGAAMATMISNAATLVYFIIYISVKRRKGQTAADLSLKKKYDLRLAGEVMSIGLPAAFNTLLTSISSLLLNNLIKGYSPEIGVSAIGVVKKLDMITIHITMGLTHGALPLIAYNYSAKNYARMEDVRRLTMLFGLAAAFCMLTLYQTLAPSCVRIFIDDPEVVSTGARFLRILSLAGPFSMINNMMRTMFQGMGKARQSFIVSVCRQGAVFIPVLFIMNALVGMYGLLWAQTAADVISDVIAMLMYRKVKKELVVLEGGQI